MNVTGTFSLEAIGPGVSTIDWVSASASISVSAEADFTISIFPAATPEGSLGLQAVIAVTPSIMLTVVLGPGTAGDSDFLPGLSVVMKNLLVNLGFQVGITIQFGVDDLFEIGATGTLGIAALFQTLQPHLAGIWVNASLSGFVQFLCFSVSFTLWSGNLYTWTADPPAALAGPARVQLLRASSSRGDSLPGTTTGRITTGSSGTRRPRTGRRSRTSIRTRPPRSPRAAPTRPSPTPTTTSRRTSRAPSVSGPTPSTPSPALSRRSRSRPIANSVSFSPQLLDLSNGSSVGVFSSVPVSEMATRVPANVPGFDLETTYGNGDTWSAPRELQGWGFPLSYQLDTCGSSATPTTAVLVSPVVDPNGSTSERLIEYDLSTGGIASNASVVGLIDLGGFDCAGNWVSGTSASGIVNLYSTSSGLSIVVNTLPPIGSQLVEATPVGGAPQDVALEYRGPSGVEAVLFDLEPETTVAVAGLPANVSGIEAFADGSGFDLFAGTLNALLPYSFSSTGDSATLRPISAIGLQRFAVAQTTYGFVVLAVPSYGGSVSPMENLTLSYIALRAPPTAAPSTGVGACRFAELGCGTADALFAGVLGVFICS